MTRLAILGFGLIGGSIARALASASPGSWHVVAWSRSPDGPAAAAADGVATAADSREDAIVEADLVVLAASPLANLELVASLGPTIAARGILLTDVSSVQAPMAAAAAKVPGLRFVGGHPMAGVERRGYGASTPGLFTGRPWVVLRGPAATDGDVDGVRALAMACGARPVLLDAATHDRLVAAISHLPMVVSAALAETVVGSDAWEAAAPLSAGGWRDTTRLARGNAELASGIAALNRDELLAWLDRFAGVVATWRASLADPKGPDAAALATRLGMLRTALERGAGAGAAAAALPASGEAQPPAGRDGAG